MSRGGKRSFVLFCLLCLTWLSAIGPEPCLAGGAMDQQAKEKLRKMDRSQVDELDQRMARALGHYYRGEYAAALPLFQEVARTVQTRDIMFWLGISAARSGRAELAVEKFQAMLADDPGLLRVRLELAAALYDLGRNDQARQEFLRVLAADPPPGVRANVERYLQAMGGRQRRLAWNLRASQGIISDDNVNFGPELRDYSAPGGILRPLDDTARHSDTGTAGQIQAGLVYDLGQPQGWLWMGSLDLYNRFYFQYDQFNYHHLDLATGPWWISGPHSLRLPVGYTLRLWGGEPLSHTLHLDPSYRYQLSPRLALEGAYVFSWESFSQEIHEPLSNTNHRLEAAAVYHPWGGRDKFLRLGVGWEFHQADEDRFSYGAPYASLTLAAAFDTGTELLLRYHVTWRDYQDPEIIFSEEREDTRHSLMLGVGQNFLEHFFASASLEYTRNISNLEIYDTDRTALVLSLGLRF